MCFPFAGQLNGPPICESDSFALSVTTGHQDRDSVPRLVQGHCTHQLVTIETTARLLNLEQAAMKLLNVELEKLVDCRIKPHSQNTDMTIASE